MNDKGMLVHILNTEMLLDGKERDCRSLYSLVFGRVLSFKRQGFCLRLLLWVNMFLQLFGENINLIFRLRKNMFIRNTRGKKVDSLDDPIKR
jgi:hypothetical protein